MARRVDVPSPGGLRWLQLWSQRMAPSRSIHVALSALALSAVALSALALTGCAFTARDQIKPGTLSPTLAPFVFKEEGELVLMTVGVGAARMRDDQPFVPFEVWVANKGIAPYIQLDRESFYLMDTFGRRY